ncbi:YbhB/YbcL family Raf kinase inhibitor-like protein [Castellaniella daejeonensis]|jgi:Raf kinase inhibitor-like YbhB/YbcL family protein|uniref:YbhB/YbcL family Raf kinase inhibitor-like protein n=1 Tax=Castellaniella daejeonensis TaxID=659013 RepID=A0ABP3D6E5_9BURK|nr:YbhB/YbcL family Raf kinase inhibitor-like protein [Castellaniella sp.]HET8704292.1 YbhB/YbcL family Raf kinase inhibitor-like protein [Castellaniella sp.]
MKLHSESFPDQGVIPERNAFARVDPQTHVTLAGNRNPHLAWSDVPDGTRSFAVLCVDPDVPTRPDDVNQEGREVPADLPRTDFFHWVLVDVSPDTRAIAEGDYSNGITPRGKAGPLALDGTRQGLNDYTGWFASDRDMNGDYFGYDGPCPPWNDALVHRYVFTVYALDVAELGVSGRFTGAQALEAMRGHVLAQASLTGTYTLNPRLHAL